MLEENKGIPLLDRVGEIVVKAFQGYSSNLPKSTIYYAKEEEGGQEDLTAIFRFRYASRGMKDQSEHSSLTSHLCKPKLTNELDVLQQLEVIELTTITPTVVEDSGYFIEQIQERQNKLEAPSPNIHLEIVDRHVSSFDF
jgi:hypothetical protein